MRVFCTGTTLIWPKTAMEYLRLLISNWHFDEVSRDTFCGNKLSPCENCGVHQRIQQCHPVRQFVRQHFLMLVEVWKLR